jgi:hypothetical protein
VSKLNLPMGIRIAIWHAHRKLCAYCAEPIVYTDLDIEHVIPESLASDPGRAATVFTDYDLPRTFDVNALCNLLPVHHRPCNLRKSDRLFSPGRARYFLEIAASKEPLVRRYIASGELEQRKSKLLASVGAAIDAGSITPAELTALLSNTDTFTVNDGLQFADGPTQARIHRGQIEGFLDRRVLIDGLEFVDDKGRAMAVRTCREYRAARQAGYFPDTNFGIKMESYLSTVDGVLRAIEMAKVALASYIREPYLGVADIALLPTSLLPSFSPDEDRQNGDFSAQSLAELCHDGRIKITDVGSRTLRFHWGYDGAILTELLRADFDGDGLEEVLVQNYWYATEGTLGYGSIGILRRTGPDSIFEYDDWISPAHKQIGSDENL